MSAPSYLLRIKLGARALAEFRDSEEGSYEDAGGTDAAKDEDTGGTHTYVLLGRHKTVIEIRDAVEARTIYLSAASGTWQTRYVRGPGGRHDGDGRGFYTSACRVCDLIRMHFPDCLTAGDLARWPAPSGV